MSTITCQAAVAWAAGEPLTLETITVKPPKAHEVRIKVLYNGLCHTDAYNLSGSDPEGNFPAILGHEGAGIVESIGRDVTSVKVGDHVLCLYTPECGECKFCKSNKTNLCQKIRVTQGKGVMPDGTTRFTCKDKQLFHFMGCSTLAQYTVVADVSVVAIDPNCKLDSVCLLGCGITTGFGAVTRSAKVQADSTVAVFGCGCVGLSVIQGAVHKKAKNIVAIDTINSKKDWALKFGATHFINPNELGRKVADELIELFDGGVDYAFDCTGNVDVMHSALQSCHKGWGVLCVIGVAAAGKELSFRPFLVVTGRQIIGSAFGGVKGRTEMPNLIKDYENGVIKIDEFITHRIGLKDVNHGLEQMESGNCIRAVVDMWN